MLLVSWAFDTILKRFRSFNAEKLESEGQRALKLSAIKLWEWFDPGRTRFRAQWFKWGRGRPADFFLRPPTLTASNVAALWPTHLKFSALKDLNLLKTMSKFQEACSILKVGFTLSKWPRFISYWGSCQNRNDEHCITVLHGRQRCADWS